MKKFWLGAALALSLSPMAFADTVTNQVSASCANTSDCTINGVDLTGSITVNTVNGSTDLKLFGAGLRSKVFVFSVPIYVAQFYAVDPTQVSRDSSKIIDSLSTQKAFAMTLTFLYSPSGGQMKEAFSDALSANGFDPKSPQLAKLLDEVLKGGTAEKDGTMTFVGEQLDANTSMVTFENTQGVVGEPIKGDGNFARQMAALWLGDTSKEADQLKSLKNDLLKDRKTN